MNEIHEDYLEDLRRDCKTRPKQVYHGLTRYE
jgi:hypothetical protein